MNDDALKQLWQKQSFPSSPVLPDEAQIAAMKKRMTRFDQTIRWRDYGEVAACVFIAVFFGWDLFFEKNSALTQAGCVVLIVSAIFISLKLITSKRLPKAEPNSPVLDVMKVELRKVESQIGLLKSIGWWYLLPLFVGVMLVSFGGEGNWRSHLLYFIFVLALYVSIYWLNQWTVKINLLPLKRALEALLRSAETGEPLDPTHVVALRPIIDLSTGTALKPVEFKVAFWQIALYGEIGFVGIWFFLMLGLTEGHVLRIFSWPHLVWIAPFFLGGLLYSWLLQKWTERAVGISALGIHLHKGQDLVLWDEMKEVRPLRILNIRSLWLIRESGEKTLMPWTGLERHSDLKAAVENFAPEKHLIRNYLFLLRPERKKSIMTKLMLIGIGITLCASIAFLVAKNNAPQNLIPASATVPEMLEIIRAKHELPALAAAVVVDGEVVETNAVGVRVNDGVVKVSAEDKFHIGSVTKSMTATVAAMLVESEKISWTTTIGELFPEFKDKIHPDYLGATLEQLLANRGGVPGNPTKALWSKAWEAKGTPAEQRLEFIKGVLAGKPEAKPGTKNIYSNSGFTIAGVMLEKASGKTWEDLMRTMLFEPLGMTSAGFGAPSSPDKIDQPWGHAKAGFSGLKPVPPGPRADNPLAISPAGSVHCSFGDLAKYAAFHMAGERGESKLLKAESFKKLHTAVGGDDYALGWIVTKRPWANGRALMHNGSNTMFYVVVWMAPEKNCAVIVASNVGADEAFAGCDEAAGKLIQKYFGK